MTKPSREWMFWFGVALAGALLACGCTTELERTALSHLAEHMEQLATEADDVARATPPEATVAPVIETMRWRIRARAKPIADELRRIKGPRVVNIPMSQREVGDVMLAENAVLDELKAEPPESQQVPFAQGSGSGPIAWSLIATVLGGGGVGGVIKLVRGMLQKKTAQLEAARRQIEETTQVNSDMHLAFDTLKHTSDEYKEAVKGVTAKNDRIKVSYAEYRTQQARQMRQNHEDAEARLPGLAA